MDTAAFASSRHSRYHPTNAAPSTPRHTSRGNLPIDTPPPYGPPRPDEIDAVARLAHHGFGLPRPIFDRYADLFGVDRLRVLRATGPTGRCEPMACAAHWLVNQWFGGQPVSTQAIAMVAVDPTRRGEGHGSVLMRNLLAEGRAAGAAQAVLWPSTLPFYQRLGFGRGGVACRWSAPPTLLTPLRGIEWDDGAILPADPRDATPLAAIRRRMLEDGNGLIERDETLWSLALCPDGAPAALFLLTGPSGAEGYIALSPPQSRRLQVADLCAATPRALQLARRLLSGYRAQADHVVWRGGPDESLPLLASDLGVELKQREEWLLRILDVRRALTARAYPSDIDTVVAFAINDPLFPENNQTFHLKVAKSKGEIILCMNDNAPTATLGIDAFSSLYSGHASAKALWQAGLLYGKEKIIAPMERLFCGPRPWMVDRF